MAYAIQGSSPYPSVADVMNLARARVNDTAFGIAGDLLSNDKPYTLTLLNGAYRWLQRRLANVGVETYIQEGFLFGLPASATNDLTAQAFVGWLGCGNGIEQRDTPSLPIDLILPLSVWRRRSGSTDEFVPMRQAENGLPTYLDYYVYDYRMDGMYFYADYYSIDLRIRYSAFRQDLTFIDPAALVPIMFCQDVLSARVAFEFTQMRGGAQAPALEQMAEAAFSTMSLSTGRRKQRMSVRRQPFSRGGGGYGGGWPVIRNA